MAGPVSDMQMPMMTGKQTSRSTLPMTPLGSLQLAPPFLPQQHQPQPHQPLYKDQQVAQHIKVGDKEYVILQVAQAAA